MVNEFLDPPAERDLPSGTAGAMRAHLLRVVGRRPARVPAVRTALVAAVLLVVVSGVAAVLGDRPDGSGVQVLAMGSAELSPTLSDAAEQCLRWNTPGRGSGLEEGFPHVSLSLADLAVAIERDDRALVLFMNDVGFSTCDLQFDAGDGEPSGECDRSVATR
ncbi:hypothetical protein GCM10027614_70850 [Micromonospora vulcania]